MVDLEGFSVQARAMGYYSWNGQFEGHAFFMLAPLKALSDKDQKTVHFAKHNIYGLTYQPHYRERAQDQKEVETVMLQLHHKYMTKERTVVGYKGGHVERHLLQKLNIPSVNLELYGCPRYEVLRPIVCNPSPIVVFIWRKRSIIVPLKNITRFGVGLIKAVNKQTN